MWYLILLILLNIFLYICIKRLLEKGFFKTHNNYEQIQNEYNNLVKQDAKLKQDVEDLEKTADETIAFYDITKEIYKTLDEDKIFSYLKEQVSRYVQLLDCKLLKSDADLSAYTNYTILPLKVDKNPIGYLVASEIKERDKDKFHILAQQFILSIKRAILYQKVQELAITDSLTQVFSRRFVLERLNEEMERSKKFNYNFSILMGDIDHFKNYNDHYGHLVGDAILREVSKTMKENIRQIDLIGRYGGEEFLVILTETDKEQARLAAERIRQAIEYKQIKAYDENLKVTISIGISTFPDDAQDILGLIEKSDRALYQAKETGRNKVCVFTVKS
jgi:diguanylate cyclase (GGDEF)-like protein